MTKTIQRFLQATVSILAFASALVGLQLHEVGAGAGVGLVKVDET